MKKTTDVQAVLATVQHDASGCGHDWRSIGEDDLLIVGDEIAGEILDGDQPACDDYVAGNGLHYRWGVAPRAARRARS